MTLEPTSTVKPMLRLNPEDIQGEILCSIYPEGEIAVITADGSDLTIVLEGSPALGINDNRHPAWLPSGKGYSYTVDDFAQAEIWVADSLEGPGHFVLGDVATYSSHSWSPDGRSLAYVSASNQGVIFDLESQNIYNLTTDQFRSAADPAWSPDGTRIAFSGSEGGRRDIYFINQEGNDEAMVVENLDAGILADRRSHPNFLAGELRLELYDFGAGIK